MNQLESMLSIGESGKFLLHVLPPAAELLGFPLLLHRFKADSDIANRYDPARIIYDKEVEKMKLEIKVAKPINTYEPMSCVQSPCQGKQNHNMGK